MDSTVSTFQPKTLLDGVHGPSLGRQISQALPEVDAVLIDCEHVSFIDSLGLGILAGVLKQAHESGKEIYLCSLRPQAEHLFSLTSMDCMFTIFPDRHAFFEAVVGDNTDGRASQPASNVAA